MSVFGNRNEREIIPIIKELLTAEYGYKLQENLKFGNTPKYHPDLVEMGSGGIRVMCEVFGSVIRPSGIDKNLEQLTRYAKALTPKTIVVVYLVPLKESDEENIASQLLNLNYVSNIRILDLIKLQTLLHKHPQIALQYGIGEYDASIQKSSEKSRNKLISKESEDIPVDDLAEARADIVDDALRGFANLNSQIFVGGHTWTDENLLETFIVEKRWENGREKRNTKAVNSAKIGDVVLMKSTFAKEGESFLRIKAIGIVTENKQDGHNLDMQWTQLDDFIDIPGLGHLRNTFQLVKQKYYTELFKALIESNPKLVDQIIRYVIEVRNNEQHQTDQNSSNNGNNPPPTDKVFPKSEFPDFEDDDNMRITSIANDFGNKDSLNFEKDVRAFSALIAYKKMKPPLAIVLFGRWGSGKSFFMNQLELRIRELSKYQRFGLMDDSKVDYETGLFHQGIAHIKFNAWSYMDANLWAGFAHSLFEKLNEYITQNTKGSIERLKVSVKISKRLEKLHGKKEELTSKKEKLEKLKKELEEEKESRILKIFSKRYDGPIRKYLKKCGLEEEEIDLLTPSNIQKRIKTGIKFSKYFKENLIEFAGFGIFAVMIWMFSQSILFETLSEKFLWLRNISWTYIAVVIAIVSPYLKFFWRKRISLKRIEGLIKELNEKKSSVSYDKEIEMYFNEISELENLISEIEESEKIEEIKASDLTQTAIEEFIERQADSEDYKKHLGIITTIRKDFETLSELFAFREEENEKLFSEKENQEEKELIEDREIIKNSFDKGRKLERIVLYIDDLDRCTDEKVIEVLEAVHLLMAFPLFTVVVGVDERSVTNALIMRQIKRYQNLGDQIYESRLKPSIHEIQPLEYLEKIFQIPFQLPKASPVGTRNLLADTIGDVTSEEGLDVDLVVSEDQELFEEEVPERDFNQTDVEDDEPLVDENEEEEELEEFEPEMIQITDFEKQYLEKCRVLVGTNPRTIKRYVNIYRICKVHEYNKMRDKETRVGIIFLLALFIGEKRNVAIQLFNDPSENQVSILNFFENVEFSDLHSSFALWNQQDEYLKKIINQRPGALKHPLNFIKRFSYIQS